MDGSETLMLTIHTNLHLRIKGARCMNCQDWSGSDVQGRVETIEQLLFFSPRAEQGLAIPLDRCVAHNIQNMFWSFLIPELVLSCVVIIIVSSNNVQTTGSICVPASLFAPLPFTELCKCRRPFFLINNTRLYSPSAGFGKGHSIDVGSEKRLRGGAADDHGLWRRVEQVKLNQDLSNHLIISSHI